MPPFYRLSRRVLRLLAMILMRSHSVSGVLNVPATGGAILAGNHISYWDPTTLLMFAPRRVRFLSKSEMFGVPVLGWIFRRLEVLSLQRNSPDHAAMREALRLLDAGELVALYPQGTRSPLPEGRRHPAKGGVLLLAERSGAPIVPVAIEGLDRIFRGRPRVRVVFGVPVTYAELCHEAGPGAGREEALALLMLKIDGLLCEGPT